MRATLSVVALVVLTEAALLRGANESSLSSCQTGIVAGSIKVEGIGTVYVAQEGGVDNELTISGKSLTIPYGANRVYLASACASSFSPDIYEQFVLLGKTLTFDVDISTVKCGCNAALYGIAMPGNDKGSTGSYYCDSGSNNYADCVEMDIMEANNHAWVVTPHQCGGDNSYCDYGGEGSHVYDEVGDTAYGYGSEYTIDTSLKMTVATSFYTDSNGDLSSVVTQWSQDGESVTMTNDDSNYLKAVSLVDGMVIAISHWGATGGGGMAWMDSPPCGGYETCDQSGAAVFSNFKLEDIGVDDDGDDDDDSIIDDDDDDDGDDLPVDDNPGNTCTTEYNINYYGNDISYGSASSWADCCDGCATVSGCTAWTFSEANGYVRCYYKSSSDGRVASSGDVSGELITA